MHMRGQGPLGKTLSLDALQCAVSNSTVKADTLRDFPGGLLSMLIIKIEVHNLKIRWNIYNIY